MKYTESVDSEYDLELEGVIRTIRKQKAKFVCIQLPDGLKNKATEISSIIERNTSAKCIIWLGTCFGACDIPNLDKVKPKIDLLIQFGHSEWKN